MNDLIRLLSMKDKDGKPVTFKDPWTGEDVQLEQFVDSLLKTGKTEKVIIGLIMASAMYFIVMYAYHPIRTIVTSIFP